MADVEILISVARFGLLANLPLLDDGALALGVQAAPAGSLVRMAISTFGERAPSPRQAMQTWSQRLQQALGVEPPSSS
jgi:hypothetical protein